VLTALSKVRAGLTNGGVVLADITIGARGAAAGCVSVVGTYIENLLGVSAYGVSCRAHEPVRHANETRANRALRPQQRPIRPIQTAYSDDLAVGPPLVSIQETTRRVERLFVS
jgi:hypothetical protein